MGQKIAEQVNSWEQSGLVATRRQGRRQEQRLLMHAEFLQGVMEFLKLGCREGCTIAQMY